MNTSLEALLAQKEYHCSCGKTHRAGFSRSVILSGAVFDLPGIVRSYGAGKVFLLADPNTYAAAGDAVCRVLRDAEISCSVYLLPGKRTEPDEAAVGSIAMHFDRSAELILGVGSGVINDLGKILALLTGLPYVIFGTAPSMDGYASGTSSVIRDGLKYSLPSQCADTVVGDLDILCAAPMRMILAGLGDMLAKYVSLAEWRMAHTITGEYYCPEIAELVKAALDRCVSQMDLLPSRNPDAIREVMNGMVLSGVAANYAGVSRPASGMEHYLSHICDMRAVEFGTPMDLHGIQCGAATVITLSLYEKLRDFTPNREQALAYVRSFSYDRWKAALRERLGKSAEAMIAGEEKERKYDPARHAERLDRILAHWDEIRSVIRSLPDSKPLADRMRAIGMPTSFTELGFSDEDTRYAILMSKDIRDKYVGSRLFWDLGILEELV